jgi:hypothetical protein
VSADSSAVVNSFRQKVRAARVSIKVAEPVRLRFGFEKRQNLCLFEKGRSTRLRVCGSGSAPMPIVGLADLGAEASMQADG